MAECNAQLANMPKSIGQLHCGAHHGRVYGSPGYNGGATHWCVKGRQLIK